MLLVIRRHFLDDLRSHILAVRLISVRAICALALCPGVNIPFVGSSISIEDFYTRVLQVHGLFSGPRPLRDGIQIPEWNPRRNVTDRACLSGPDESALQAGRQRYQLRKISERVPV